MNAMLQYNSKDNSFITICRSQTTKALQITASFIYMSTDLILPDDQDKQLRIFQKQTGTGDGKQTKPQTTEGCQSER